MEKIRRVGGVTRFGPEKMKELSLSLSQLVPGGLLLDPGCSAKNENEGKKKEILLQWVDGKKKE